MKKIQLNLGCGVAVKKGFINVDKFYTLEEMVKKEGIFANAVVEKGGEYVQADMCELPFKKNYADYIETVDAIEHITFKNILAAFMEIHRVLKKGGKLVLMTTNFDQLAEQWLTDVKGLDLSDIKNFKKFLDLTEVIYGNQNYGGEYHLSPMNPQFLALLLRNSGFDLKKVKMTIYPKGTKGADKMLKTQKWAKDAVTRTEMILVEAIK